MRRFAILLILLFQPLLAACAPQPPARAEPPAAARQNPLDRPPPRTVLGAPAKPDTHCKTDADCTVKNVGNCCGYYPACVSVTAKVDPEAVAEQCRKTGKAGACGFPEISACTCAQGQCKAASNLIGGP
ncbi:hypothetical protein EBB59_12765 [Lysobacter pythonis]|uniref:Secreted protein n=1 Tax=Solilutibacter pythonis TaxID=2483112 RepID=A0A3M2HPD8_9GAMM|nr:hypothetical protein [Lysobacter pythonis]RMH87604.1 hypothetical protein EBB59_12765 [Lysobacter pythonis]